MRLLDVECSRLIASEVYRKAGRSTRVHVTESGVLIVNTVAESGTAIRAWGEEGGEAFVTIGGEGDRISSGLLRRIESDIGIKGRGCPRLPGPRTVGPVRAANAPEGLREPFTAQSLSSWLLELRTLLPGCTAWLEAGASIEHLENSNGFEGDQGRAGWHLTLSTPRPPAAAGQRTSWFSTGGSGYAISEPGEIASRAEARWTRPDEGSGPVILGGRMLAEFLEALGELFVPETDRVRGPLTEPGAGERVAPAGTEIVSYGEPGRFDGEGLPVRDVTLVRDGFPAGLLVDLSTARDLQIEPTGSARRDSYRDYPKAGPMLLSVRGRDPLPGAPELRILADGSLWRDVSGRGAALISPGGVPIRLDLRAWLGQSSGEAPANRVYLMSHYT